MPGPTKKLGKETRKFLNYLDIMLMHSPTVNDLKGELERNGLNDLLHKWNKWWRKERGQDVRIGPVPVPVQPPKTDEEMRNFDPAKLEPCPRCGLKNASFCHPTYDGGSYVHCDSCHYAPQAETWACDDRRAAEKWNKLKREAKQK